jgi:large subunit ribosomal protein L16
MLKKKGQNIGIKRLHFIKIRGVSLNYDLNYGIKALEKGYLSSVEIEAVRKIIRKRLKKKGNLKIRIYPFLAIMRKPLEVRMGKGKGNRLLKKVSVVKPGQILYELDNVSYVSAYNAYKSALMKLSIKVAFVGLKKKK